MFSLRVRPVSAYDFEHTYIDVLSSWRGRTLAYICSSPWVELVGSGERERIKAVSGRARGRSLVHFWSNINGSVKYAVFQPPDPRADTIEQSADTTADTAKYKRRAHKHGRYEGRYARYRNFQYPALRGASYLRICSCVFHWVKSS
jgi:hypothetical protein